MMQPDKAIYKIGNAFFQNSNDFSNDNNNDKNTVFAFLGRHSEAAIVI